MRETIRIPATVAGKNITVVTHTAPHADEILALFLIEEYGDLNFLRSHCHNGEITVGVGGGQFDDHNRSGEKASSARLVATALNVVKVPQISGLLAYVHRIDSEGGDTPFQICSLIKLMGQLEWDETDVIDWACRGFWAKCQELEPNKDFSLQNIAMLLIARNEKKGLGWLDFGMKARVQDYRSFFVDAAADFKANAHTKRIRTSEGEITLCWIESDNPAISRYARSEFGASASIVVVKKSTGNVAIMVDKRLNLDLGDLAAALKLTEQQLRGAVHVADPDELRKNGTVDESWDVWHYAHGCMLLNGSHTAKGISPTAIPLEKLLSLIETVLNPTAFEPNCEAMCSMGICPANQGTACSLQQYGLARCRAIQAGQ